MINNSEFNSVDEAQYWVLANLLEFGEETNPRGMKTLELFPISFKLLNPRKRCVLNSERKWSLPLALGEFCWHTSGSDDLSFIEYYIPRWREFSDNNEKVRGSCYGHRIFNYDNGYKSQWKRLVKLLKKDPQSRRAILQITDLDLNLNIDSKDVPCTCTIQFLIRQGNLHAIVYMRSNDAIWGLPFDVFLFTMLQELLSCELGYNLGTYTHIVGSMHLYERHFEIAKRIIESPVNSSFEMPKMDNHFELSDFLQFESIVRQNFELKEVSLSKYWIELLEVLKWFKNFRTSSTKTIDLQVNGAYKQVLKYHPKIQKAITKNA